MKLMHVNVDNETLKNTSQCKKDFICLSGTGECLSKVEHIISKELCFIEGTMCGHCNFKLSFGYSSICTCPTRKEIYNRYEI
jgi:hypothetical protein